MKLTVTKEFTFDCAHMLSYHGGLCSNLHGHTYRLEVTASKDELINVGSAEGMIIDFGDLKRIVKDFVIDKFDHSFLFWERGSDAEREIAETIKKYGMRIVNLKDRPTAENIAVYIINTLNENLMDSPINIVKVRLYETPTSYAEVKNYV